MSYYPPDFKDWPEDRKNVFFAKEARNYRELKPNGAAETTKVFKANDGAFGTFGSAKDRRFSENDGAWSEPKPLPDGLLPVAPFDPAFLPDAIAPWVTDISDRMQCPPDFIAIPAMVASAPSLAAKWGCVRNGKPIGMRLQICGGVSSGGPAR